MPHTYEIHNFSIFHLSPLCPPTWPLPDSRGTAGSSPTRPCQRPRLQGGCDRVPGRIRATDVLPALPGVTLERPVAACPLAPAGSRFNLPAEGGSKRSSRDTGFQRCPQQLLSPPRVMGSAAPPVGSTCNTAAGLGGSRGALHRANISNGASPLERHSPESV
ncbi:hypothetical protein E1301_Tti020507 [Triplophysa tibetana]|uniref:Uncharacterized protein n=1 Tax=Triplophysa tibetana TaxID=1572043 RepID=A0A5A9NT20_9TELE|nr:hypothetical protein E1301_Tti020507 [Triplophysa tibetana]